MAHPIFPQPQTTRRSLLKSAVFGSVVAIAAPYVKDSYAAGSLALGVWDHWVPGANNAFAALCNEWGTKNNVEVRIDFITSQGEKDKLTAAAEAQASTGHDIIAWRGVPGEAMLLAPRFATDLGKILIGPYCCLTGIGVSAPMRSCSSLSMRSPQRSSSRGHLLKHTGRGRALDPST
jgi:hypothetical protein